MKKRTILTMAIVFCMTTTALLAEMIHVPFKTSVTLNKVARVGHVAPVREINVNEADLEPNDWDGDFDPFPPAGWAGDLGILPYDTIILTGQLDSCSIEDWYTGDTDLFGFDVPAPGVLELIVDFHEVCDPQRSIYNALWLAEGTENFFILDTNFDYPYVNANLVCPLEIGAFIEPGLELDPLTHETAEYYYLLIAGAAGDPTAYTATFSFIDCTDDADGDEWPDEACGGFDCDDSDPNINPDVVEDKNAGNCEDGIDNDCDDLTDNLDDGCGSCFVIVSGGFLSI